MPKKIVIIGAGPAGATLAIYLKRYNIDSTVIENGKSNLLLAKEIENYYGIDSISGQDLYNDGLNKLDKLGIRLIKEEVLSIEFMKNFFVKTTNNMLEADILVLASGLAKKSLNLKNLARLEGKGVSYCATCDAFFYRKKKIGIVGYTSFMEEELAVLERVTDDITIFTNGNDYQNDKHEVVKDKIIDIFGNEKFEGVIADKEYPLDGLFIANGSYGSFAICKHLGLKTNSQGEILVSDNYETNIKGVYAIGDAISDIKQVGVATSHGIRLAYHLFRKLMEDDQKWLIKSKRIQYYLALD